jgi:uncharacterized membrane protein YphA (DoxX/SURF4 family)
MKFNTQTRNNIVSIICYIYVVLFTYAATSKFLDFENFRMQLGQSPLVSAYVSWIPIVLPIFEFIIAILLLLPRFRLIGLFAAYTLMAMFTAYIYIILNFSAFVPCSCGGILENMTWNQHLVFNICFIILAGIAILLMPNNNLSVNHKTLKL